MHPGITKLPGIHSHELGVGLALIGTGSWWRLVPPWVQGPEGLLVHVLYPTAFRVSRRTFLWWCPLQSEGRRGHVCVLLDDAVRMQARASWCALFQLCALRQGYFWGTARDTEQLVASPSFAAQS